MKHGKISEKSIGILSPPEPALDIRPTKTGCSSLRFSKKNSAIPAEYPFRLFRVYTQILLAVRNTETFRQRRSNFNVFIRNSASFSYNTVSRYVFGRADICPAVARWVFAALGDSFRQEKNKIKVEQTTRARKTARFRVRGRERDEEVRTIVNDREVRWWGEEG